MLWDQTDGGLFSAIAAPFNMAFERDAPKAARPSTLLQGLPQIFNHRCIFI